MSLVRICDRCHAVIPEGARVWRAALWEAGKEPDKEPQKDYCETCSKAIFAVMAELPTTVNVKSERSTVDTGGPKERKTRAKTIDVPGMMALRKAGWSLKAIAQEHGLSVPTVAKLIRQEEEKSAG